MKLGINAFVTDESIRPDVLAAAMEERGFDALFLTEHSHIPVSRESPWSGGGEPPRFYYRTLDPFLALTAASAATSRLLLGTGIALLIQRDPIHAAKEVASLDWLSGGRVLFGVGVGWNREEMRNHGTDPRTRGALLDEQLAAMTEIWTQDKAEFHGEYVDFDPIYAWPKPVQRPHPPVYIGGESQAALTRLANHGDAWLPRVKTEPEEIQRVSNWLARQGRPETPMTVCGAGPDAEMLSRYADVGVDRVTFTLDTKPEEETLRALDELAVLVDRYR